VNRLRWRIPPTLQDSLAAGSFGAAESITARVELRGLRRAAFDFDRRLDRLLTSRVTGFPLMLFMLMVVFWLTIAGANVPSAMLATGLIDQAHPWLHGLATAAGFPGWLSGFLLDGDRTAWVVNNAPPMLLPLFTLPVRCGWHSPDSMFRRAHSAGAYHAWGSAACRRGRGHPRPDNPTQVWCDHRNNLLCNGRWPTQILLATIFVGAVVPAPLAGLASASAVVGVTLLGVGAMFFSSWLLSATVLRGEATTFSLELPPYRPPRLLQTLYTSLIDRTLIVLWRAVVFAAPAGAAIWLMGNLSVGEASRQHAVHGR
jgi:ferrous iron transport protein B